MAFQAKRLRVALPCGGQTVVEQDVRFAADEKIIKGVCVDFSQHLASCFDFFTWYLAIHDAPIGADMVLDAEHLPIVRQQLEAQLAEVQKAEQALQERQAEG